MSQEKITSLDRSFYLWPVGNDLRFRLPSFFFFFLESRSSDNPKMHCSSIVPVR